MSFSQDTLQAVFLGAAAALPMVGLRLWSWSPDAAAKLTSVEDMHSKQLQVSAQHST